jgi:hypothetical protein
MSGPYSPKVSRRETLHWFAAASVGFSFRSLSQARPSILVAFQTTPNGFGADPDLHHPAVTWHRIMDSRPLQLTAVLADLILPGSDTAPAPSAAGVPDFIDEWISAPYPEQVEDRALILAGLNWIDGEAGRRWQRGFLENDEESRQAIVHDLAKWKADDAFAMQAKFFLRFRFLVVGAYYTTPQGFKDIGYMGNVPLRSYPAVTDEERAILEKALSTLGL